MDGFKFKGIPLSTIIDSGTTTASGYTVASTALKYDTTTFANSRPLLTGYQVKGVDLSNTARAHNKYYNSTKSGTVPIGAKSCRFVLRGGGGGCGGGSGAAVNKDGSEWWSRGHHGTGGAQGSTAEGKINISGTTYTVTIGSGGTGGNGASPKVGDNPNGNIKSAAGGKGATGGPTNIKFTNTTPSGVGGAGGNGGPSANAPGPGGFNGGYTAWNSRPGQNNGTFTKGNTGWDATYIDTKGLGGVMNEGQGGGTGGNTNYPNNVTTAGIKGRPGQSGSAHIIWLYE